MGFDLTIGFFFPHISSVDFCFVVSFVLKVAKYVKVHTKHNLSRERYKGSGITVGAFRLESTVSWHL